MENIGLTEKTEKLNRTESVRFGSVAKSNRFGSVLQKLAKTEPNRPMLTPKLDTQGNCVRGRKGSRFFK